MIQIDIDADLNMVDDDDRNLARTPANPDSLRQGGVLFPCERGVGGGEESGRKRGGVIAAEAAAAGAAGVAVGTAGTSSSTATEEASRSSGSKAFPGYEVGGVDACTRGTVRQGCAVLLLDIPSH